MGQPARREAQSDRDDSETEGGYVDTEDARNLAGR